MNYCNITDCEKISSRKDYRSINYCEEHWIQKMYPRTYVKYNSVYKQSDSWLRHGKSTSDEYHSWQRMKHRCFNENASGYESYGGRGIKVCERWLSFQNFFADMGECPPGHTLDRINTNGDYEPGNCRWATKITQQRNRRLFKNNQSGYRGVYFRPEKVRRPWYAFIRVENIGYHLGYFETSEDAAIAYDVAAIQLNGQEAKLNILTL